MSDEAPSGTVEVSRVQLAEVLDYVRNDAQLYDLPDDVVEAHADLSEALGDGASWTSVRRSVPAEEMAGIADDATVWACFVEEGGNKSVTVYKSESEAFAVVAHRGEESVVLARGVGEDEAMSTAEGLKQDRALWTEHGM